jgi:hypothetical protein
VHRVRLVPGDVSLQAQPFPGTITFYEASPCLSGDWVWGSGRPAKHGPKLASCQLIHQAVPCDPKRPRKRSVSVDRTLLDSPRKESH